MMVSASGLRTLGTPQSFDVKPVNNLPAGTDVAAVAKFQQEVADLRRRAAGTAAEITRLQDELRHMRAALLATPKADPALFTRIDSANKALAELTRRLNGDPARQRLNESASPSIADRVSSAMSTFDTRLMPTATQRRDAEIASTDLAALSRDLGALVTGELAKLRAALEAAGAPWIPKGE